MLRPPDPKQFPYAQWALFLDIDGTLLDIVPHPDLVVVPMGLPYLLKRVHSHLKGACALISGRDLACIDRLLTWDGRDAAGCHGAELRIDGAIGLAIPDANVLRVISDRLISSTLRFQHTFLEIKRQSIALHYGASGLTERVAGDLVRAAYSPFGDAFRMLPFRNGVELVPHGVGKDKAIARFLDHARYAERVPIFAGDDITDEAGFSEVNVRGGISIALGKCRETQAQFKLEAPTQLCDWLQRLLPDQFLQSRHSEAHS